MQQVLTRLQGPPGKKMSKPGPLSSQKQGGRLISPLSRWHWQSCEDSVGSNLIYPSELLPYFPPSSFLCFRVHIRVRMSHMLRTQFRHLTCWSSPGTEFKENTRRHMVSHEQPGQAPSPGPWQQASGVLPALVIHRPESEERLSLAQPSLLPCIPCKGGGAV